MTLFTPCEVQRKRVARSVRGIAKDVEPTRDDALAQEEAGYASSITEAETLEIPEDAKISQVVAFVHLMSGTLIEKVLDIPRKSLLQVYQMRSVLPFYRGTFPFPPWPRHLY